MAEKYVRCNSHCKYPAYDKEEVDALLDDKYSKEETNALLQNIYVKEEVDANMEQKQNTVLSGTTEPDNSLGVDGDIYLKYDE